MPAHRFRRARIAAVLAVVPAAVVLMRFVGGGGAAPRAGPVAPVAPVAPEAPAPAPSLPSAPALEGSASAASAADAGERAAVRPLLAGRVVDPVGAPVPGATVLFLERAPGWTARASLRGTSGADGRFALFGDVEPGLAGELSARRSRRLRTSRGVPAVTCGDEVVLVVCEGARLEGRIEERRPPANLRVALFPARGGPAHRATLDARGRLKVADLPPGDYDLRVTLGEREDLLPPERLSVADGSIARPPSLNPLVLGALRTVDVRVRARDRRALGARIEHRRSGTEDPWSAVDARGGVARLATRAGGLDVRAWAPGYRPGDARGALGLVRLDLAAGYPVELRLPAALLLETRGLVLELVPSDPDLARYPSSTGTEECATFTLRASVPGPHDVRIRQDVAASDVEDGAGRYDPPAIDLGVVDVRAVEGVQTFDLEPSEAALERLADGLR